MDKIHPNILEFSKFCFKLVFHNFSKIANLELIIECVRNLEKIL